MACIFPDGYEGANKIGSGQIPIGDVIDVSSGRTPTKRRGPTVTLSTW